MPSIVMPAHKNNFDALRLFLAALVLFSHSYALAGVDALEPIVVLTRGQVNGGGIAVDGFFVISGYLITWSWLSTGSADKFLRKRILRIYPGFLAALAVSFAVAILFSPAPLTYANGVAVNSELVVRGVLLLGYGALDNNAAFPNNPFPHAVNGSLWTLQPELFCYLIVVGAGVLGLLTRRRLVLFAVGLLYAVHAAQVTRGVNGMEFTGLLLYFALGALYWLYRDRLIPGNLVVLAGCAAAIIVGEFEPPLMTLLLPAVWSYLLLSFAFTTRVRLHGAASHGDFSYGVYLYAFVVQQAVAALFPVGHRPLALFATALPITFGCAWLSWNYVEAPFMRRKAISSSGQSVALETAGYVAPSPVPVPAGER
jgi:peptidoglycan/LPS O-acetylase OafA/YrhL